jgi:hypothetical protein
MTDLAYVLSETCTGPNRACRAAHREGRSVHVIPGSIRGRADQPALIMPTYHFATVDEGMGYIRDAWNTAPMVVTDEDLDRYRAANIAHKLPVGWVDPSRRR